MGAYVCVTLHSSLSFFSLLFSLECECVCVCVFESERLWHVSIGDDRLMGACVCVRLCVCVCERERELHIYAYT